MKLEDDEVWWAVGEWVTRGGKKWWVTFSMTSSRTVAQRKAETYDLKVRRAEVRYVDVKEKVKRR